MTPVFSSPCFTLVIHIIVTFKRVSAIIYTELFFFYNVEMVVNTCL